MKTRLKNSIILITGGTGSWGQELTRQLLDKYSPQEIRIYSRGEHRQVDMKRNFQDKRITYFIGDVRDKDRLMLVSKNVDYLFHLAALKHVPVCEENPWEAVQTNIIGTQHVIECALENKIKKVIDVSTDKAVDPFNLYGVTKAAGEKLIIAANLMSEKTKFVCIRGGNVIGTNGSVVPLFFEQIQKLNTLTLTDKDMTRFFTSLNEAIQLVLKATLESIGGEVLVMKMPSVRIIDLATVVIERLGNKKSIVKNIGIRAGEKLHEVLVSKYEISRTYDFDDYFVILPSIHLPETKRFYKNKKLLKIPYEEFNSTNTTILNKKEIAKLLDKEGWFTKSTQPSIQNLRTYDTDVLKNFNKSEGWS